MAWVDWLLRLLDTKSHLSFGALRAVCFGGLSCQRRPCFHRYHPVVVGLQGAVGFFRDFVFQFVKCKAKGMLWRIIWYELLELGYRSVLWIPKRQLALILFGGGGGLGMSVITRH